MKASEYGKSAERNLVAMVKGLATEYPNPADLEDQVSNLLLELLPDDVTGMGVSAAICMAATRDLIAKATATTGRKLKAA